MLERLKRFTRDAWVRTELAKCTREELKSAIEALAFDDAGDFESDHIGADEMSDAIQRGGDVASKEVQAAYNVLLLGQVYTMTGRQMPTNMHHAFMQLARWGR
jgi:hypothetical protein